MSSENGQNIKLTVFGESHASAVGVVIEGLPAGEAIDEEQIMQFMRRRMGGKAWSTPRKEEDRPEFLCGLLGGRTTGAALCAIIRNSNIRPADYENMKNIPRVRQIRRRERPKRRRAVFRQADGSTVRRGCDKRTDTRAKGHKSCRASLACGGHRRHAV